MEWSYSSITARMKNKKIFFPKGGASEKVKTCPDPNL
jgi:hypothetical protein